jgi:hypothetical protein
MEKKKRSWKKKESNFEKKKRESWKKNKKTQKKKNTVNYCCNPQ